MKIQLIFAFMLFFGLFGCKKVDKWTQFEMEYDETVIVPSATGIDLPFNVLAPDVKTNSESTFAVNETRKDLIEEILLTKLALTLTSPQNGSFSFLKSIDIYMAASGLPEAKIAWKDEVSSSVGKYLELDLVGLDLKDYIKKDQFTLRVSTVTDEVLTSDHHIDLHSKFFVDAKILGQ